MYLTNDQVEWDFLEEVMGKVDFSEKWIDLILWCISLVIYSIMLMERGMGKLLLRGLYANKMHSCRIYFFYVEKVIFVDDSLLFLKALND